VSAFLALYRAVGTAGVLAAAPVLAARALTDPRYRAGWGQRLGLWTDPPRRCVWVHGASVGELRAAAPLVRQLRTRGRRVVVTATSPAGAQVAAELAGAPAWGRLLPLDPLPWLGHVVARLRPRAVILVETELWPGFLGALRGQRVPVLLVNARISDRSFPRYRRVRSFLAPVLGAFRRIQAQSEVHARRFLALGAPPDRVEVGGNLKFDLPDPDPFHPATRLLRQAAEGLPVVVAGSTHPGEERAVARAVRRLSRRGVRAGLVVAPRHLERLAQAEEELRSEGVEPVRWTDAAGRGGEAVRRALGEGRALIVDRFGVLPHLYGAAAAAYVGGTLAPVGGHNPLEALVWGVPVVLGPHTANIRDLVAEIRAHGLGTEVRDPEGLAAVLEPYLTGDPERVRAASLALFGRNRGATRRALEALEEALRDGFPCPCTSG